jgi:hypothetical protein
MIGEKSLPCLRGRFLASYSILRHSSLGNFESDEAKLRFDPRHSPQWILARHLADQLSNLLVDLRTSYWHLRLPTAIKTEPLSVPFDDRIGFDDDQDLPPIFPESRQHHPEEPISLMKLRPLHFTVEDGKLLAKSKNLCREADSGLDQRTEKQKERREDEHGIRMSISEEEKVG